MSEGRRRQSGSAVASREELASLARAHGTPLYVYDLARLRARVARIRSALEGARAQLFFATMANDRPQVLAQLAGLKVGACVNSIPHLELARYAGFSPQKIQFTSTGISLADMRMLQALRVRVNIDSLNQLEIWLKSGGAPAGIRVNAASLGRGLREDRIGVAASEVLKAAALAESFGRPLEGLHIYVGTNLQWAAEMLPTLGSFFELAAKFRGLAYVNIGGGIGIDYRHEGPGFDLDVFGSGLAEYANRLRRQLGSDVQVIMEPGRGLSADCGIFITSVTDVKQLRGERFAAVDGSIAIFPRPFHHPDSPHRIMQLTGSGRIVRNSATGIRTVIVGRTTFSRDILGTSVLPKSLTVGDILAFDDAGAYCQSMASRFLGQRDPHVVFVGETAAQPRNSEPGIKGLRRSEMHPVAIFRDQATGAAG